MINTTNRNVTIMTFQRTRTTTGKIDSLATTVVVIILHYQENTCRMVFYDNYICQLLYKKHRVEIIDAISGCVSYIIINHASVTKNNSLVFDKNNTLSRIEERNKIYFRLALCRNFLRLKSLVCQTTTVFFYSVEDN